MHEAGVASQKPTSPQVRESPRYDTVARPARVLLRSARAASQPRVDANRSCCPQRLGPRAACTCLHQNLTGPESWCARREQAERMTIIGSLAAECPEAGRRQDGSTRSVPLVLSPVSTQCSTASGEAATSHPNPDSAACGVVGPSSELAAESCIGFPQISPLSATCCRRIICAGAPAPSVVRLLSVVCFSSPSRSDRAVLHSLCYSKSHSPEGCL